MTELSIERIDVFQVDLPYSGGVYKLSGGREYRSFDATIVRIQRRRPRLGRHRP